MTNRLRIATRTATSLLLVLWATCGSPAWAATPGELADLARQSTFEVVLPKLEPEHVRYEKPLPLELLSYTERNDKFWSIGTAFAIAPDTFVSAAHVLLSGMGSPLGHPHLRDSSGKTFLIDKVLKFSLHEDYIVFRATGAGAGAVLQANRDPQVGATVFAVGNALGEGVVLRDGLLTSLTPEDQDGRWKWLRFSAAASPGNSGGPLLDSSGHVLGVVSMKSSAENLNYALPIALVLDAKEAAGIDMRSSFGIPILREQKVVSFKEGFALPATWDAFSRALLTANDGQYARTLSSFLAEQAGQLPPGGQSSRLLATLDRSLDLGLIRQQPDDTWGLSAPESEEETELSDGGRLWVGSLANAFSFRLQRSAKDADARFYHDAAAFMDTLLKGLKIPRVIGPQAIRITSLGVPKNQELQTDRFGRIWQRATWSLGYSDMQIIVQALPTPEGYTGLLRVATAAGYEQALKELQLLADYFHAPYQGRIAQWKTFLAERDLRPPLLRGLRLGDSSILHTGMRALDVQLDPKLLQTDAESALALYVAYRADSNQLHAELAGITLWSGSDDDNSWLGIWGQPQPGKGAGSKLEDRWRDLSKPEGKYSGLVQHDDKYTEFWSTSVLGDASRGMLYEVTLSLKEKGLLPRQVTERRDLLIGGLKPQ